MRVVLDSNILISAFVTQGLCRSVLEFCLNYHQIILSEELLQEVSENLQRKIKVPPPIVNEGILFLRRNTTIEKSGDIQTNVCRDPNDIKVLSLAITVTADIVITGDKDLLALREFRSIPILSPRDFWTRKENKWSSS